MIISTVYIEPNITVEREHVGTKYFYIYNYKGVHYRVFSSYMDLQEFLITERETWAFDCLTENELEKYLKSTNKKKANIKKAL